MDGDRTLVNSSGYRLLLDSKVPDDMTEISVAADGTVNALTAAGTEQSLGVIQLAHFANPSGLLAHGNNVWLPSDDLGKPQTGAPGTPNLGIIQTHVYEQSNINLSEEMTNMITLQRAFQMSVKAFQQTDTMITEAIHMRKG